MCDVYSFVEITTRDTYHEARRRHAAIFLIERRRDDLYEYGPDRVMRRPLTASVAHARHVTSAARVMTITPQ